MSADVDMAKKLADGIPPKRIVLASGVFDMFHVGHLSLLKFASSLGTLFVGVASDNVVEQLKGPGRPVIPLADRLAIIRGLRCVYDAFPIHDLRVDQTIRDLKPTVWVKGSDYTLETLNPMERQAAIDVKCTIRFAPRFESASTTGIIRQVTEGKTGSA